MASKRFPTIESAKNMLRGCVVGIKSDTLEKAAALMVETDVCAWHAFSVVSGKPCWCAKCAPQVRRFA